MAETNAADVADNPVIATPVAENEEDTEDWRIQAEAFKSEGRLLCDIILKGSTYDWGYRRSTAAAVCCA